MPNTLCHIALQVPLTRVLVKNRVSLPWIVAGCIIPDIPWVILRGGAALALAPMYDLRMYTTVQASLFFCLILSFVVSLLNPKPLLAFLVLALNSALHLFWDSTQIKWANGVHFFGPFSWEPVQMNLLWPENPVFMILSLIGLLYLMYFWKSGVSDFAIHFDLGVFKWFCVISGLLVYILLPPLFMGAVEGKDNNFIKTLRGVEERAGKKIEVDREVYDAEQKTLTTRTGDVFALIGDLPRSSGVLSIRGTFKDNVTINCEKYQMHSTFRYGASFLGLFMCCTLWLHSLLMSFHKRIAE